MFSGSLGGGGGGGVVFQELRFLRILQGNENHRVAAGGNHAPGQPDHGVIVAANPDLLAVVTTPYTK